MTLLLCFCKKIDISMSENVFRLLDSHTKNYPQLIEELNFLTLLLKFYKLRIFLPTNNFVLLYDRRGKS